VMVFVFMIVVVVVMRVFVTVIVSMVIGQMNVEFHTGDPGFFLARDVEVVTIDAQFLQFMFELMRVDAEVQQRAEKHIAADAAEDIEVKDVHKFQAPNSKLQRNSKFQDAKRSVISGRFGACDLKLP
jgi:hypothetical protein